MGAFLNRLLQIFAVDRTAPRGERRGIQNGNLRIFISYRRADSAGIAGRIYDRLTSHFGSNNVFMDIDSISLGLDFASALQQEISQCDAVLILIGHSWLPRLQEPSDFIRHEIEIALAHDKVVVPLLVDGAPMPRASDLPPSLQAIANRNAVQIGNATSFHRDLDILISSLERISVQKSRGANSASSQGRVREIEVDESPKTRVFLSHATNDRPWVEREIVETLSQSTIPSWYARTDIRTATQWEREILKGMESCGWFLLVASPRSAKSEWVKDEVFWAMQFRPSNFITVVMEPCDLYQFHLRLPRLQHIDFPALQRHDAHDAIVRTVLGPK